jgi:hypothetical protein
VGGANAGGSAASGLGGSVAGGTASGGDVGSGGTSGAASDGGSPLDLTKVITGVQGVLPGAQCASETVTGQLLPLDMYVMMDRSISMGSSQTRYLLVGGGTKWAAVQTGFSAFVTLPQVAEMGMGIQFFGKGNKSEWCDPATYASPFVEIAPLPGVGPAILNSFKSFSPSGDTPLTPALTGAIQHARDWKLKNPTRHVIAVLVTDGLPNGCGVTTDYQNPVQSELFAVADALAQVASDGLAGVPSIQTFMLVIEGQELDASTFDTFYSRFGSAGGTTPLIVKGDSNLATEFASALDRIRAGAILPCSFQVPPPPAGQLLDYTKVNVVFTPTGSAPTSILFVADSASCGNEAGWYYDNQQQPNSIELCPTSCNQITSTTGSVEVVLGCTTVGRVF